MRNTTLLLFLFLLAQPVAADPLDSVQRLAAAGAPHLALQQLLAAPPAAAADSLAWQREHLALLLQLHRSQEVMAYADDLPATAGIAERQLAYDSAARAAAADRQFERSRRYLAHLLWEFDGASARAIRRRVIDSYVNEGRLREAYLSMLRFRQDFSPLPRDEAESFVRALALGAHGKEALGWLGAASDNTPTQTLLKLKNAALTAPAAIAIAQAALRDGAYPAGKRAAGTAALPVDVAGWWTIIRLASQASGNATLQLEAGEELLQHGDAASSWPPQSAENLWTAYFELAQPVANRFHLLQGDDAAWLLLAAGDAALAPVERRALLAFLSANAATAEVRLAARTRLRQSLNRHALGLAAQHLFWDIPGGDPAALPAARHYQAQARALETLAPLPPVHLNLDAAVPLLLAPGATP